jgi:hypothetical protein
MPGIGKLWTFLFAYVQVVHFCLYVYLQYLKYNLVVVIHLAILYMTMTTIILHILGHPIYRPAFVNEAKVAHLRRDVAFCLYIAPSLSPVLLPVPVSPKLCNKPRQKSFNAPGRSLHEASNDA